MCVLSIKVPIRKKSGDLFNYPRTYKDFLVQREEANISKCIRLQMILNFVFIFLLFHMWSFASHSAQYGLTTRCMYFLVTLTNRNNFRVMGSHPQLNFI